MFKSAAKTELNQISLTGMRAIVLLGLLMVKPRSLEEIKETLIKLNIMEDDNSYDILRIDLNTLKVVGCDISRASQKTNYKYILRKHPFSLKLEEEEIKILKRAYDKIKNDLSFSVILQYDNLFRKLANHLDDEERREQLLGISALRYFDINTINDLTTDCNKQNILKIIYKKPTTNLEATKEIVAQKLVFKNDKVYIFGFDINAQESVMFNLKRIKSIVSRRLNQGGIETKETSVKLFIKGKNYSDFEEGETVKEVLDDGYIVEGTYHNEFLATQRILSFGKKCIVLEPEEFRASIITKIKEMRNIYDTQSSY